MGGSVTGSLETAGDRDWFRIELVAGQTITIALNGFGATPVSDVYLRLRDANGVLIAENDDGGPDYNSLLSFVAASSGTYFLDVGAYRDNLTGGYQLSVAPYTPPPVASVDQIANQLVFGYWDGAARSWGVSQGSSLTVNITGLTSDGQFLARNALGLWSDITGIRFVEVTSGGQILFDDNQPGASAISIGSGGRITSSQINVSTDWLTSHGRGLNSYSFQTYIHEIGHALGLGHAGNYNEDASYATDALFRNDGWPSTIMSYFDQSENMYFRDQGFTFNHIMTPQVADVLAMSMLYGLSTTTRTGDTTYGFNSNAGRAIFDANQFATGSYTIFDSGGIDTLNYSGFSANQTINLNPNTFSNVGSNVGNVSIAIGTVIENATGGSGNDRLIGNDVANRLIGGSGNDVLDGRSGADTLIGDAGADNLDGGFGDDFLSGGEGNDWLSGGAGSDALHGGDGSDVALYASYFRSVEAAFEAGWGSVTSRTDGSRDTLTGMERLDFNDGMLMLDANGVAAQIMRLYDGALGRAPDLIGLDSWVDAMEDLGLSLKTVAMTFLRSAELKARLGGTDVLAMSDRDYVNWLYQHVLGRTDDTGAGVSHWLAQLGAGRDRADLLLAFTESAEHRSLTDSLVSRGFFNTDDDYQAVALLYDALARRPDAAGLTYWAELLEAGTMSLSQIADVFAASTEFRNLTGGMNNAQLVDFMYRTVLDRAPDAAGLSYWTGILDRGMDHGDLIYNFTQSSEHVALLGSSIVGGIDVIGM